MFSIRLPLRAVALLLLAVLGAHSAEADAYVPVVDLGYANYRGIWDPTFSNNTQFLGIRYAAPPIGTGALRFNAPQPPPTRSALYPALEDAKAQPPQCRQAGLGRADGKGGKIDMPPFGLLGLPESEDCLFLNVYVPGQIDASKRLPVIVWIHGGGFAVGSIQTVAGFSFYNGDDLIYGMQQVEGGEDGAVVVLLQYRLGMFGFLAGKAVKEDGALNAGLLDQQLALQWVQEHIVKFGGDPSRVTIWGQSAGAQSVLEHVIANNGQTSPPLFKRGITSSTAILTQYRYNDSIPEGHYADVLREVKCSNLKCLRKLLEEKLAEVNKEVASRGFFSSFVFVPVVDGSFLAQSPSQALKERKVNGEDILVTTNSDEGTLFANPMLGPLDSYIKNHFPHLTEEQGLSAAALFEGLEQPFSSVLADTMFDCPALSLLDAFPGRAYKGLFAIPPAFHGLDVAYYFFSQANDPGASPYRNPEFQRAFTAPFFYFILNGTPNPGGVDDLGLKAYWDVLYGTLFDTREAPRWEAYHDDDVRALDGGVQMLFNHTEDGVPVVNSVPTDAKLIERCRFWDSVAAETGR
ncbi:alpha/beta-hydrolase [Hymenopellis radicata]|nr:alpha/beta-hydrolase [Hymenopellis radicata]